MLPIPSGVDPQLPRIIVAVDVDEVDTAGEAFAPGAERVVVVVHRAALVARRRGEKPAYAIGPVKVGAVHRVVTRVVGYSRVAGVCPRCRRSRHRRSRRYRRILPGCRQEGSGARCLNGAPLPSLIVTL